MINISDIPLDQFYKTLSAYLAVDIANLREHKEWISQNEAYNLFKRRKVEEWVAKGKITPRKNGQRVEYRYETLFILDRTTS